MFHSAYVLLATSSLATAAPPAATQELETPPIYFAARTAVAVPANANGDVVTVGPSLGIALDERNTMGLRVIYMDDPPANPLATSTPEIPWAWGPVVDWHHHFQPHSTFSFYTSVSLGYVYGVPEEDSEAADEDNVILPILEGGLGVRLSKQTANGNRLFLSPELGFVPGAVAPYAAISVGFSRPGSS